ncbi:MAG TPA: metallophosphoesterase [Pyrinomonadaceae bacterium]|jgi:UDP-2,3-diacylglucosamine pyrophosphatase LpxH
MRRLFVISDLHLGGRPDAFDDAGGLVTGFQINNSYAALTEFVDWVGSVARAADSEEVELVINGDIVDFLAEDDSEGGRGGARVWAAGEAEACARLDQIALRTRGGGARGVFDALKDFVAAGNRLTLLLGNHDVELSLPRVRGRLDALTGGGRGLVRFVYDGEAYTPGRVLIEHGNRYDRWNMIDYSALRQERSMLSRGLAVEEERRQERYFVPPAGTYLVVHFMNRVKARYRFIDLLKPETNAMLPLLLALEPDLRQYLGDVLNASPIVRQYLRHGLETSVTTKWPGDLSAAMDDAVEELSLDQLVLETFREAGHEADAAMFVARAPAGAGSSGDLGVGGGGHARGVAAAGDLSIDDKLDWIQVQMRRAREWFRTRAGQLGDTAESASLLLGLGRAETPEGRLRQLHAALRRLNRDDRSFSLDYEEKNYADAARRTSADGDFDAVLYGHTHLPKKMPLDGGGGRRWYLNTGTWCDVIRLPEEVGSDYETARPALAAFADALGRNDYAPYVRRYLSYAELAVDDSGGGRLAEEPGLYSYCGAGRERSAPLTEAHTLTS